MGNALSKYSPIEIMIAGSARISLGLCSIFLGIGLFIILRGDANDTYAGILVCCIALIQLFGYGIWRNLECTPGGSNDRGTRGLYMLLWFMPAILCLAASFFATNVFADSASRMFLMGVGGVFGLLALAMSSVVYENKNTMCSVPGKGWQPKYSFLHDEKIPMKPNLLLLVGLLIPTLLVDPFMLGAGTVVIALGSYALSKQFDPFLDGEWLSVHALLMNAVAIWALLVPAIRRDLTGVSGKF
jgi:hypothetical protein